jgi:hypothetical protein
MGRLDKIKRELIEESNKRMLNEQSNFIENVADNIDEPYFKNMKNDYRVFKENEQLYVIVKKINPSDITNYLKYNIIEKGNLYIVKDKDGKEIYSEKK